MFDKVIERERALYAVQCLRKWYEGKNGTLPAIRHYGVDEARIYFSELAQGLGVPDFRAVAVQSVLINCPGSGEQLNILPGDLTDLERMYKIRRAKAAAAYIRKGGKDRAAALYVIEDAVEPDAGKHFPELGITHSEYLQLQRDVLAERAAREIEEFRQGDFSSSAINVIYQARELGVTYGQLNSSPAELAKLMRAAEEHDAALCVKNEASNTVRNDQIVNTIVNAQHERIAVLKPDEIGIPLELLDQAYDCFTVDMVRSGISRGLEDERFFFSSVHMPVARALRRMIHVEETGVTMERLDELAAPKDPWDPA